MYTLLHSHTLHTVLPPAVCIPCCTVTHCILYCHQLYVYPAAQSFTAYCIATSCMYTLLHSHTLHTVLPPAVCIPCCTVTHCILYCHQLYVYPAAQSHTAYCIATSCMYTLLHSHSLHTVLPPAVCIPCCTVTHCILYCHQLYVYPAAQSFTAYCIATSCMYTLLHSHTLHTVLPPAVCIPCCTVIHCILYCHQLYVYPAAQSHTAYCIATSCMYTLLHSHSLHTVLPPAVCIPCCTVTHCILYCHQLYVYPAAQSHTAYCIATSCMYTLLHSHTLHTVLPPAVCIPCCTVIHCILYCHQLYVYPAAQSHTAYCIATSCMYTLLHSHSLHTVLPPAVCIPCCTVTHCILYCHQLYVYPAAQSFTAYCIATSCMYTLLHSHTLHTVLPPAVCIPCCTVTHCILYCHQLYVYPAAQSFTAYCIATSCMYTLLHSHTLHTVLPPAVCIPCCTVIHCILYCHQLYVYPAAQSHTAYCIATSCMYTLLHSHSLHTVLPPAVCIPCCTVTHCILYCHQLYVYPAAQSHTAYCIATSCMYTLLHSHSLHTVLPPAVCIPCCTVTHCILYCHQLYVYPAAQSHTAYCIATSCMYTLLHSHTLHTVLPPALDTED